MFDGIRNNRALRRITDSWFWDDVVDAVSDFVRSRALWAVVGNAGTFLAALAGLVYWWSRPFAFADYAIVQLGCLAFQAVALIPVALPRRSAERREVAGLADLHQGLTVTTVCGSWIFGVFPGAVLFIIFDVDVDSPPWAAVFFSGTALMLACVAGLITATIVSDRVGARRREGARPPGGSGGEADGGDGADVVPGGFGDSGDSGDSGGFDGD